MINNLLPGTVKVTSAAAFALWGLPKNCTALFSFFFPLVLVAKFFWKFSFFTIMVGDKVGRVHKKVDRLGSEPLSDRVKISISESVIQNLKGITKKIKGKQERDLVISF